ncbi:uncharacterized protein LOC125029581 [Penaeus chinensis]|uniref:uncharacterized protein LOC125029581 n=1 Tax=Penaeus chinensis TaxID=139456 RepID=UPI001FB7C6E3|nr:uncharacterized protein LOC125029581 [Penaeus chinensis]
MDHNTYLQSLSIVGPSITKENTLMRKSISAHDRLKATLMFLATGQAYEELKHTTSISAQSLGRIVPETCKAIWASLQEDFMKFPESEQEWIEIAKGFEEVCNFPRSLGVCGGKHVLITPPPRSGTSFYNYRRKFQHGVDGHCQ